MIQVNTSYENIKISPAKLVLMTVPDGYNFELVTVDNEKLLTGNRFRSAVACIRAMMSLKKNAHNNRCIRKCISTDNRYFFVVLNVQGSCIASSDLFRSAAERDRILLSAQRELMFADMVEE